MSRSSGGFEFGKFGFSCRLWSMSRVFVIAAIWGSIAVAAHAPPLVAQATQDVRGTIRSQDGTAVPGAMVSVEGTSQRVVTRDDGSFQITGLPAGSYVLQVRAIGWREQRVPVEVGASVVAVEITLTQEPILLSDVVVSTSREARAIRETAVAVGVVDRSVIEQERPHHPADIVRHVPGAWVTVTGGEGHFTAIRQPVTTKPVYVFLEDGVPTRSTGFFNHNGLYEINLPQAERVEVIKGPGSAIYGSDAVGGVVSSSTRAPAAEPELTGFLEFGGFNYSRALLSSSSTFGRHGFRADLNLTRTDGFRNGAPYSRQSGTFRWDVGAGEPRTLKTVVSVSHIDQSSDGGSPLSREDFETDISLNYNPIAYRRVLAVRGSSSFEARSDWTLFTATVYARHNTLDLMPMWQLSFDPQVWETKHNSIGALLRVRHILPQIQGELSTGLDLEYSPGSRKEQQVLAERQGARFVDYTLGDVQYDYDVAFKQAAVYAQADVSPFDRLHLDLGVRADLVGYDYTTHLEPLATGTHRRPPSSSVSFRRVTPKLGVTFDAAEAVNLFASYRGAFRVPEEGQLFRQGSAESTLDLRPVKADNFEVGIRAGIQRALSFEATLYELRIRDDILTFQDPGTGLRFASNAGETLHRGVELGATFAPSEAVNLSTSWTLARHTYESWQPNPTTDYSGNVMESSPRSLGRVGLRLAPSAFRGASVSAEWVHFGRYWQDAANTSEYPGHNLANLAITVPITDRFEITGRVDNIMNERYAEMSSWNPFQGEQLRPGQPRTVYIGIRAANRAR